MIIIHYTITAESDFICFRDLINSIWPQSILNYLIKQILFLLFHHCQSFPLSTVYLISSIIYESHRSPCILFPESVLSFSIKYGGRSWSLSLRKGEESRWAILRSWFVMLGPRALNLVSQQRLQGKARGDFQPCAFRCMCVCVCVPLCV